MGLVRAWAMWWMSMVTNLDLVLDYIEDPSRYHVKPVDAGDVMD